MLENNLLEVLAELLREEGLEIDGLRRYSLDVKCPSGRFYRWRMFTVSDAFVVSVQKVAGASYYPQLKIPLADPECIKKAADRIKSGLVDE